MTERLEGRVFRRSPAGATALTVVAVGLGAWGVINSPVFGIDRVRVEGVHRLDADAVRRLAGVREGTNLLRLSRDTVAGSVERSPWVAEASVERSLPTTLVIGIVERRPAGWFGDPEGGAVVATDGTVLERVAEPPSDLPALGPVAGSLEPGAPVSGRPVALRVAAAFSPRLQAAVGSVAQVGDEVELVLRGGGRVLYGEPTGLQDKGRTIEDLLAWAQERGVAVASIDVRVPGAPALRPQHGA